MSVDEILYLYITAADMEEARRLGRALVEERLAACVNILGAIESLYWWEGSVQSGQEVALVAKTSRIRLNALKKRLSEIHSYDCPCLVALPVVGGHVPFLDWVVQETTPEGNPRESGE